MEATCPHCQARLNVPAPGAYACGNCGKRVDVAPEPGAEPASGFPPPASFPPPAGSPPAGSFEAPPPPAGAYGLEPPSTPASSDIPAVSPPTFGTPAAPQTGEALPPSWVSPPPPGSTGSAGLPPTAPLPAAPAPPPFGGSTIPGMPGTPAPPVYGAPQPGYAAAQPGYAVPPVVNPAEQAPCANHPGNAASGVCERCGDFMCRLCTTTVEGRNYCPKCFDLLYNRGSLQFTQRQFVLPGVSFGLGIGALIASCVCFLSIPLGIGGVWTAVRALKEYGERPDLPNRWMANTGLVLSILGILEGIGTIVWFIILSMRGGS